MWPHILPEYIVIVLLVTLYFARDRSFSIVLLAMFEHRFLLNPSSVQCNLPNSSVLSLYIQNIVSCVINLFKFNLFSVFAAGRGRCFGRAVNSVPGPFLLLSPVGFSDH